MTIETADRHELRQIVRDELQLLFREALPASIQARVAEAVELRAGERFNVTGRTLLTLDDKQPTSGQVLGVDANGFAQFIAAAGGYTTVQDEGGPLTQRSTMNFTGAGVTAADSGGVTTVTIPGGGGFAFSRGTLAARPTAAALGSGNVYYTTDTFQLVRSNGATYDEVGLEDIFTTKGDLVVASAADTPQRFAVGTDGQCLISDSTAGNGLRYVGLGSVTGSLVTAQTPLTTKGDLFGFGPALARVPVSGTNNQVLAAVSANATGVGYIDLGTINGSIVRIQTPLTTKGDILSTDGTTLHRVGVGTKAQALVADSAQTDGVKFGYPVAHYMQQQALNGATADGLPRCNMVREAIQNDVASTFATGVMSVVGIWLEAGLVITRIGCINGATAGATLTHRWAAIYTPGGAALGRQSTDVTTATTTANTWLEFTLSATYTVPADGYYIIGVMFAGTTMPTARGGGLGNAIVGNPTGATGVTFPFVAGSASTALTTTAPAGPLTITAQGRQFAVWLY